VAVESNGADARDAIASRRIELKARGGVNRELEWEGDNPEELFREIVNDYADGASDVLDVECGDGSMARETAKLAGRVVGVDISGVALAEAASESSEGNVCFVQAGARPLPFADDAFDLAYSHLSAISESAERLVEIERVIKPGALLVALSVGESHWIETQEIFGRGVNWPPTRPVRFGIPERLEQTGLTIIFFAEYYGSCYSPDIDSYAELLETTPLIPDFDRAKDAPLLREAQRKLTTPRGIRNTEHVVVFVAQKAD